MTKNIREILSPLLIISYVCGLRVVEFPAGNPRQWFNLLYIFLLWSFYYFILIYKISYIAHYSIEYHVCLGLHLFTALLSIAIGIYYDKIFRNCIKKLTILDDTLEKLGTITDYHKFKMKIIWLALGWSVTIILMTYLESYLLKENAHNILSAILIPILRNYCSFINFIGNLIIVTILGYIGLKFEQINKHLEKFSDGNKRRMNLVWEHSVLYSYKSRLPKTSKNKYVTWIVMHLHSELRKISREIDSIFGTQMTLEMGCCFAFVAMASREIFNVIFIKNYIHHNNIIYVILVLFWLSVYIFRLLLINYVCERVSIKASATRNIINRFSYYSCNVENQEKGLQFLLQISQSPLKFYGLGLFKFGFKFLYGFSASILTVLIIYLQAHTNNEHAKNNN